MENLPRIIYPAEACCGCGACAASCGYDAEVLDLVSNIKNFPISCVQLKEMSRAKARGRVDALGAVA